MTSFTARDLNAALWAAADEMRKAMTADVYKNYLLGLVFYKALSDNIIVEAYELLNDTKPDSLELAQEAYAQAGKDPDVWPDLNCEIFDRFGCVIQPKYTFSAFYEQINARKFMLDDLRQAFREIETAGNGEYTGLFADFNVQSTDLGQNADERNAIISSVIMQLAAIDFSKYPEDALGDAYEYLISQFAAESGKKAGEFYTPQSVSQLIARIVTHGQDTKYGFSVYDPTCGSGSLLLQIRNCIKNDEAKQLDNRNAVHFFGQEIKNQTYNLARMNMMLHRVPSTHQHLHLGNTLSADWPTDEPTNFDAVVMNPPYSQKYDATEGLLTDPRFSPYKRLAPKSKADFAFLLHGYYHLKDTGTMGIVLPHGVLFRGAAEAVIREELLNKGAIHAVIGLPAGIFFSTGIPTCVVILTKNNTERSVLFVDASNEFRKEGPRCYLDPEHIDKIVNTVLQRKDVEKFAHLATFKEIKENNFNLNISRYIDNSEEEPAINIPEILSKLKSIETKEIEIDRKYFALMKELNIEI